MTTPQENGPTDLYRHYDEEDRLLYVGISLHSMQRQIEHKRASRKDAQHWFDLSKKMTKESFPTRREAEIAEKRAIQTERPIHNKVYNQRPERRYGPPSAVAPISDAKMQTILGLRRTISSYKLRIEKEQGRTAWFQENHGRDPSEVREFLDAFVDVPEPDSHPDVIRASLDNDNSLARQEIKRLEQQRDKTLRDYDKAKTLANSARALCRDSYEVQSAKPLNVWRRSTLDALRPSLMLMAFPCVLALRMLIASYKSVTHRSETGGANRHMSKAVHSLLRDFTGGISGAAKLTVSLPVFLSLCLREKILEARRSEGKVITR